MTSRARFQILWIILLLVIASIAYLIGYNYFQSIKLSKNSVLSKLKAITCTAVIYLDAKAHKEITEKWKSKDDSIEHSQQYNNLRQQLKRIQEANNLNTPIYTLIYDSSYHLFQFVVTSSGQPKFRQDYIHFPNELIKHFDEGSVLDTYESESGTWLSAFAPIKDEFGKTIGLLQADEDFSTFISQSNGQLIKQSSIALASVLPFVAILFFFTRRFLMQQEANERNQHKQQLAIINQSNIIKNQNQSLLKKNQEMEIINTNLDTRVRERTEELMERTQELKTYLYRSSHDMRGPLTSLMGLSKLLLAEGKIEPYASMIYQSTLLMTKRIQSLSEVYEITTKKIELTNINICNLVSEVDQCILKESKIDYIICEDIESCKEVIMDEVLIKILMKEAVHNAVYHNRNRDHTKVWIKTKQASDTINIEISDNGIGMNESTKEKAFDMFFRGNELSKGIGLGLFKIKMVADRLKGKVSLFSREGNGSSLSITLPCYK